MASSFEVNVNVPSRRAHVASTERRRSPRVGGVQVGNLVRLTAAVTPTLPTLGLGRDGLARKEISTEKQAEASRKTAGRRKTGHERVKPHTAQAMPTLDVMRATFCAAAALLSNAQLELFEHATGTSASHLVDEVLALPAVTLSRVLDLGHGELGNNVPHPLNAKGLHVLRWLLARVIVDERREQNGWRTHALYDRFKRDGILMRKLQHWEGSDRGVPLTTEESELIALATGRATNPYLCADKDGATRDYATNRTSGLIVRGSYAHTFRDDDAQYQLHVDVYLPNIKFMVFTETVVATNGPFHFVRGSHKASAAKARWLFERTLNKTDPSRGAGAAFRHVNEKGGWCTASSACLREAYNWQQHDLARSFGFPLPTATVVEAGTLVVVDTSGFHFRGIGVAGRLRARMGKVRGRKSNPPSFA